MARIIINSTDSFGDQITQKIIAKKTTNNGFTIFSYDNKQGKGEIKVSSNFTEIMKYGETTSHLIIDPKKKTDFYYKTPYLDAKFKVSCKSYSYSENKLTTVYSIYDNGTEVNQLAIEIIEIQ